MKSPRLTSLLPSASSAGLIVACLAAVIVSMAAVTARAQDASAQQAPAQDHGKVKIGESLYRAYCPSCHGATAEGDGPLAESLRVAPANLTLIARANDGTFPFERVVSKIDGRVRVRGHGTSDMPVWGDAFTKTDEDTSEEEVRDKVEALAHFLRSIQAP